MLFRSGDWGAVARLFEEYEGCENDGCLAIALGEGRMSQLEMVGSPEVLAELFGGSAPAADASKLTTADRLAQSLALGVPLEPQGYNDLLGLAARGGVGVLLALRPSDLVRSFGGELEPVLLGLTNKPNELDNEQIELLYVGAALGFVAILGATLLTSQPPAYDPLAF